MATDETEARARRAGGQDMSCVFPTLRPDTRVTPRSVKEPPRARSGAEWICLQGHKGSLFLALKKCLI